MYDALKLNFETNDCIGDEEFTTSAEQVTAVKMLIKSVSDYVPAFLKILLYENVSLPSSLVVSDEDLAQLRDEDTTTSEVVENQNNSNYFPT